MANTLVSVNECVVHDQRVAKGSGLCNKVRIKVEATKGGMRLTDCGFESAKIPDTGGTA